ncbi:MAG: phenylacetate--CoA ligase family protein [Gemmataceae bacterium]
MDIPSTPFYARKLADCRPISLADFPFTTKAELVADQAEHPPYGSNLTRPLSEYTRLHQTSGTTTGRPLVWLDTPRSWDWALDCWRVIYERAGVNPGDRAFFAFSFGPFLGFWTAFESAQRLGMLCISGGGMSSAARLRQMAEHRATVILCTPTYALHLADSATANGIQLSAIGVKTLILAGEPGALIAATRAKLEQAWNARIVDHYGLTEVGPVAVEPAKAPGALELLKDQYIAEVIDPVTLEAATTGELVLTNLGRLDSPLVRYRTGDLVRLEGARFVGGILGRVDDMIHVRGNNVYPSAIEGIIRRFPEIGEFQVEVETRHALCELTIRIEAPDWSAAKRLSTAISDELLFRAEVVVVPPGSLPRFDMKANRFIRKS